MAAHQAPLSMGFSRQEYWSGVPLSSLASSQSLSTGYLSVTPFCFQDFVSILLSLFWILFQADYKSPPWFGGHLLCSFTCWIFLCLFIVFRLLCLAWPFFMLEVCGSFLLWKFLQVGGVGWVVCQGFLVKEACFSFLVGGARSPLSGGQWSVQ